MIEHRLHTYVLDYYIHYYYLMNNRQRQVTLGSAEEGYDIHGIYERGRERKLQDRGWAEDGGAPSGET